jgi:hypothetical protein
MRGNPAFRQSQEEQLRELLVEYDRKIRQENLSLETPATREQIEALCILLGVYISDASYSDEWHVRLRIPPIGSKKVFVNGAVLGRRSIGVCTWPKELPASFWAEELPRRVKLVEEAYSLELAR